jgi:hypothetical protein
VDEYRLTRRWGPSLGALALCLIPGVVGAAMLVAGPLAPALGVIAATLVLGAIVMAPALVAPAALTAAGLRYRRSMFARGRTLLPWSEIARVELVSVGNRFHLRVTPRDGSRHLELFVGNNQFRLYALRAATKGLSVGRFEIREPPMPDPPTVDLARARVPTRVLRPSRLTGPVLVVLAAAGVAVYSFGESGDLRAVRSLGSFLVIAAALTGALALRRTEIDGNVLRTGTGRMPWHLIRSIDEHRFGPLRWIRLTLWAGDTAWLPGPLSVVGPAPRFVRDTAALRDARPDGVEYRTRVGWEVAGVLVIVLAMLAITTYQERPWYRAAWPGVGIADATPDPCAVSRDPARQLVPEGSARHSTADPGYVADRRECVWKQADRTRWLTVVVDRSDPDYDSAEDLARRNFDRYRPDGAGAAPGIGDEAVVHIDGRIATVVARRANIVVHITYGVPDGDTAPATEQLLVIARNTVSAVRLR